MRKVKKSLSKNGRRELKREKNNRDASIINKVKELERDVSKEIIRLSGKNDNSNIGKNDNSNIGKNDNSNISITDQRRALTQIKAKQLGLTQSNLKRANRLGIPSSQLNFRRVKGNATAAGALKRFITDEKLRDRLREHNPGLREASKNLGREVAATAGGFVLGGGAGAIVGFEFAKLRKLRRKIKDDDQREFEKMVERLEARLGNEPQTNELGLNTNNNQLENSLSELNNLDLNYNNNNNNNNNNN